MTEAPSSRTMAARLPWFAALVLLVATLPMRAIDLFPRDADLGPDVALRAGNGAFMLTTVGVALPALHVNGAAGWFSTSTQLGAFGNAPRIRFGQLPPGRYRLTKLFLNAGTQGTSSIDFPADWPEFTIEPGRLTDLGAAVYQRSSTRANFAFFIALAATPEQARTLARDHLAGALPPALWDAAQTWAHVPSVGGAQHALLRLGAASGGDCAIEPLVLCPLESGQVFVRGADGGWGQRTLPTVFQLRAASASSSGKVIVGGDFGTVMHAPSIDGPWTDASISIPGVRQVVATSIGDDGRMHAVVEAGITRNVLSALLLAPPSTSPERQLLLERRPDSRGWTILREWTGNDIASAVVATRSGLVFHRGAGKAPVFDLRTGEWSELEVPGERLLAAAGGSFSSFDFGSQSLDDAWFNDPPAIAWIGLPKVDKREVPTAIVSNPARLGGQTFAVARRRVKAGSSIYAVRLYRLEGEPMRFHEVAELQGPCQSRPLLFNTSDSLVISCGGGAFLEWRPGDATAALVRPGLETVLGSSRR